MKKVRAIVLVLLLALAVPFLVHRHLWASVGPHVGQNAAQPATSAAVRIDYPKENQKLAYSDVTVRYELLANTTASGTPTYELRLDGRDPVTTTFTTYTFNGLKPGAHDLILQIVDANGTPLRGTRTEVHFTVAAAPVGGSTSPQAESLPPSLPSESSNLPLGNSSLPLLSIIGFGILVGGVISALRTRTAHK